MGDAWTFETRSADGCTATAGVTDVPQRVIVKVRSSGYIPDGFAVRSRVDGYVFTADADDHAIGEARRDPQVDVVDRGERLRRP